MNRKFRLAGFAACSLALLLAVGAHWPALQSVAWGRMLFDYSRTDSFATAIRKTFDGEHPCSMCIQIREDRSRQQREQADKPWLLAGKALDLFFEDRTVRAPVRLPASSTPALHISEFFVSFIETPPTPPPRA